MALSGSQGLDRRNKGQRLTVSDEALICEYFVWRWGVNRDARYGAVVESGTEKYEKEGWGRSGMEPAKGVRRRPNDEDEKQRKDCGSVVRVRRRRER